MIGGERVTDMWKYYALLSAVFAALTAILAKAGVRSVDSNLATAIRTLVILFLTWGIVFSSGGIKWKSLTASNLTFLVLSGIATGLSWLFYFKALQAGDVSRVAPLDKLSVAITVFLGILIFHEPATPTVIAGALLIVAGSLVMLI